MIEAEDILLLAQMHKKYGDLVWYARKGPEHMKIEGARKGVARIEAEHPEECAALRSEGGDWDHGFNSGCYAVLNILMYDNMSEGIEEFPMLDT